MKQHEEVRKRRIAISAPQQVIHNSPLSKVNPAEFEVTNGRYKELTIEVVCHAPDHAHLTYGITNGFRGLSLDDFEAEVRSMNVGHLSAVARFEDLGANTKALDFTVTFMGATLADIFAESERYLDDLARRCASRSGGTQVAP